LMSSCQEMNLIVFMGCPGTDQEGSGYANSTIRNRRLFMGSTSRRSTAPTTPAAPTSVSSSTTPAA
jgi:hypothetical protein